MEQRWNEHIRGSRNPKMYVQYAIRKHGVNVWKRSVLQECVDLKSAKLAEIQWISKLNTMDDGYNCTPGGDAVNEFTDEIREKIREAARQRKPISEQTRERMRRAAKNRPPVSQETRTRLRNVALGRKVSDETRRKMKEASRCRTMPSQSLETRQKRSQSMRGKNAKAVEQCSLDGDVLRCFESISEAQKVTSIKNISQCCLGRRPRAGGYVWRYVSVRKA
jgi:group I intron endonuclease